MKKYSELDWGWMDRPNEEMVTAYDGTIYELGEYHKKHMIEEIYERKQYEEVFEVKEGDVVVDIGASIGPFTHSILHKNPSHVYCLEPSENEFLSLVNNLAFRNVTLINKGISHTNGRILVDTVFEENSDKKMNSITFNSFVEKYNLKYIDFLKTDCEGGEYNLFRDENIDYLLNNVGHIVGEWHLGNDLQKVEFRYFRDKYLKQFKTVEVRSIDGINIKWDLWNDSFLQYYKQVILHISNKHE